MTANAASIWRSPSPLIALVVEPSIPDRMWIASVIASGRVQLTLTETFSSAKAALAINPPHLLITELRLGEYNGLHLVLRARAARPDVAAIVLSSVVDSVLQAECERLGGTYVLKPVSKDHLLAAVTRTALRPLGDRTPVRWPFERRVAQRRTVADDTTFADRRIADRRQTVWGGQPPGSLPPPGGLL